MIGHNDTTSSLELDEVGRKLFGKRWLGVVPSDRVPPRRPDSYLIAKEWDEYCPEMLLYYVV
jgi:hypothetical protein